MLFSKASLFALFSVATLATAMDYHQLSARDADPSELYIRNNEPRELYTRDGQLFAREAELHQLMQRDAEASAEQHYHYKRDILRRVAHEIDQSKIACQKVPCGEASSKEARNSLCTENGGCGTCDFHHLEPSRSFCRAPGATGW